MKNTLKKSAHTETVNSLRMALIAAFILVLTGCGEVDSNDGQVVNNSPLPTDSALKLFCPDAGIADEPCILDDPDNPYAITPVVGDTRFDLANDAPSAKARFYVWATAQAISPQGENQFFVARSLHEMFGESGSELARQQALRAYRSLLDNYFNAVTFFGPFDVGGEEVVTPSTLRITVAESMYDPAAAAPTDPDPLPYIFDDNVNSNRTLALATLGEWGYTYNLEFVANPDTTQPPILTGDVTPNF